MIEVLYKRLSPHATPPLRMHEGDAGWDLSVCDWELKDDGFLEFGCGLSFAIPRGYYLMIAPRSSVVRHYMSMVNSVGIIDSGFRGEVTGVFKMLDGCIPYECGERFLQAMLMPCRTDGYVFREVAELPGSWDGRGDGGYGSTGD